MVATVAILGTAGRGAARIAAGTTVTVLCLLTTASAACADQVRADQWHLQRLGAAAAWHYATGAGVIVAVIDSGVDATHPDLMGQVLPGLDLVAGSATDGRVDRVGHGTTVASFIAGRADDPNGVLGLAPRAKILPVRVLDDANTYEDASVVADGLRWAVDHGASVVNLSLGGAVASEALARAIRYAGAHEVVVVACTGNRDGLADPGEQVWYPAREPGVVAVAGLATPPIAGRRVRPGDPGRTRADRAGRETLWSGSITGPQTVLTAPSVDLVGARPGGYWKVQGTSFAAPLVAATAALVRSRWPTLDAANVISRLTRTARDLGPPGRDDQYGFGEIDPVAALTAPVPKITGNPLVTGNPLSAGAAVGADDGADGPGAPAGLTRSQAKPVAAPTRPQRDTISTTLTSAAMVAVLVTWIVILGLRHRARHRRR